MELVYFAKNGDKCNVLKLLKEDADPDVKDEHGWTALMYACIGGLIDIVRFLLKYDADVNIRNPEKMSSLVIASKYNYVKIVLLLVQKEANGDFVDIFSNTAMHYAAYNKSSEILSGLISSITKEGHINKFTGLTALMVAVINREISNVRETLNLPSLDNIINIQNPFNGMTSLMYASKACYFVSVFVLLEKGANANCINCNGDTALILASRAGCERCVRELLLGQANPLLVNNTGQTAKIIALFKGYHRIVRYIDIHIAGLRFNLIPPTLQDQELQDQDTSGQADNL